MSLASAYKAFTSDSEIADPGLRARFDKTFEAFLSLAEAAKHYQCIKLPSVEFLGEPTGAGMEGVDPAWAPSGMALRSSSRPGRCRVGRRARLGGPRAPVLEHPAEVPAASQTADPPSE